MSLIVHIGKPGSFSHAAARIQYGVENTYMGCKSFDEVFKNVAEGHAEIGIVPLENSLAGSIYENYDLFNKYPLFISAEQYLKVEHFLLAKKGEGIDDERLKQIQTVFSHPKALEQCQSFFDDHPWMKSTASTDTASAAQMVATSNDQTIAAIGSLEAAHLYRLQVIAKHVEDDRYNFTRFVYVTKTKFKEVGANKCSLQIEVKHEPGSLVRVLQVLNDHGLNMTKIESRPVIGKPFEYQFYLDFEFDAENKQSADEAIDEMGRNSNRVKVLGVYKAGILKL